MAEFSTDEIIQEARKRENANSMRNQRYRECEEAYYGEESLGVHRTQGSARDGRPINRMLLQRTELLGRGGAPNMILPVVEDFAATRSRMPLMKVMPWSDAEEEQPLFLRLSRALRSQWLHSDMIPRQLQEFCWYLSVKGEALLSLSALYPNEAKEQRREPGVYITVVDPSFAHPDFRSGSQKWKLEDVITTQKIPAFAARRQWGDQIKLSGDDEVDVVHYQGPQTSRIIVNSTEVARHDHGLPFCPAVWVRLKPTGRAAQSDVSSVLDLHSEMQVMFLVMSDTLVESTYSQLVIRDPVNVQKRFEVGPGAEPIVVKSTGGVDRIQPGNPPQAAEMILSQAWGQYTRQTGSAPLRTEGRIDHSNISGRSLDASMTPMAERAKAVQERLGAYYGDVNEMIMRMLFDLEPFKTTEMQVYGIEADRKTTYSETFRGEEFQGWTRSVVTFGSSLGMNVHEASVVGLNLHDKGLLSGVSLLEALEIPEPEREMERARQEKLHDAELQAKIQSILQGGKPAPAAGPDAGQGGPAQPGPVAPPPSEMGQPAAAPPGQAGPPGLTPFGPLTGSPAGPIGTPPALPDMQARIREGTRRAMGRMRGEILNAVPAKGGVEVTISDKRDTPIVRDAFTQAGFATVTVVVRSAVTAQNGAAAPE